MALGLDKLTDDQLFNLCKEMCAEFTVRDPFIRAAAQQEVLDSAQRLKIQRDAIKHALEIVRDEYVIQIENEVESEVRRLVQSGEIRLVNPKQEAVLISEADREAKAKLIKEIKKAEGRGLMPMNLNVLISGKQVTVTFGSTRMTANTNMGAKEAREMLEKLIDF